MKEDSKLGLAAAVFWPPGVWPVDLRQSYPMLSFIDFDSTEAWRGDEIES